MKQNQLDRIIKLVRRTGDRFVIMDKETDGVVVLMDLNEYEHLLNDVEPVEELEEEEMLNKLNYDISRWQEKKNRPEIEPSEIADWNTEDDEIDLDLPLEPEETKTETLVPEAKTIEPTIAPVPETVGDQTFAEETLSDLPEGEEEKFYLEPIE